MKYRKQFTTKVKNNCIIQWEINTGQSWSKYTETIYSKNGIIIRNMGDPYNAHHIIEATFKAVARAIDMAVALDERNKGVPSTKGVL